MSFLISFFLENLPFIIGGFAALFGVGYIYRKGRIHSRAKSDKELKNAVRTVKKKATRARKAGDSAGSGKLRADDGNKRK